MPQNVPGMQQQTRSTTAMTPPSGRVGAPASSIQTVAPPTPGINFSQMSVAANAPVDEVRTEGTAEEPDEDTKRQTRERMPTHSNFLQFQKRLAETIGTELGTNPNPATGEELDDLEPGDPAGILQWARDTGYDVKQPTKPSLVGEFITGRKMPRPGQKPMGPRADAAAAQRANTGASPAEQRASNIPMPPGAQPPGDRPGEGRPLPSMRGGPGPAYQNLRQAGVAESVPMGSPGAPAAGGGGAFRSAEDIAEYRQRPEAARGQAPSAGPSRATGSATDRAQQEIRVNREQASRPGGFTAPGERTGSLPEGTNYMRYLAEESFTGDMSDKAAEVRGGAPSMGGTPTPPPSGRTGGALPEQQGGDMSAAADQQDQATDPQRIPQVPGAGQGGGQGGAFTLGAPTAAGGPLPGVGGTMQDVMSMPQQRAPAGGGGRGQGAPAQGGAGARRAPAGGGATAPPTPGQRPQGAVDQQVRQGAVAPGGANTGGRAGPGPARPGPGGSASGGAAGPGPMGQALQQRSPTFRKMTESPAETMKQGGFDVNETFNKLMKEIGREPEEVSLSEDQKARLMMEMGLRMMTQSGKPGATFLGAIGNAGLNTMQTAKGMKQEARQRQRRASERRQQALQTKLDVSLQREQMAAETAQAQQERAFEAWQNQLDRETEVKLEQLENQYGGGENMGSFAKRVWFYENQLGLGREEAVARAEATGSASPRNLRMEAQQTFFDLLESNPQALEQYGYDYSNPGETQDTARQRFIDSYVGGIQTPQRRGQGAPSKGAPQPGTVEDGYRFKGGDPADQGNWEKVE